MSTSLGVIAVAFGLLGNLTACVEIDGGAVELAWALRGVDGDKNDCKSAGVTQIRACWQPVGDGGLASTDCVTVREDGGLREQFRDFDCTANRGITRFEVAPGPTSIFIKPLCADGLVASGPYQVPPPIVRTVEQGRVVTLNQLLIVATGVDCDPSAGDAGVQACTCAP